ncbi:MAG TPA: putative motility protein [Phycisphaerae bacterium]|nr:putative motility protein [Phycisphaerae bacterium]
MISPAQSQLTDAQLTPARVASDIGYAVAAKTLNAERQQGAAILDLLNGAANTQPQPSDPSLAQATGLGNLIDTTA